LIGFPLYTLIIAQGGYFVKGFLGFFIRHFAQKLVEKIMLNCAFCLNQDRLRWLATWVLEGVVSRFFERKTARLGILVFPNQATDCIL
jgi:hypothetical protein